MISIIPFVFGAIVGSFLNCIGLRWGTKDILESRSFCPHCRRSLSWWELIPIVSFFILKRRCSSCHASISWQYPLAEVLTGLLFATLYYVAGFTAYFILLTTVFSIYFVIAIYDIKHKIIPDSLVYASTVLGLSVPLFFTHYTLLDWLAGPIIFTFFALIWLVTRGRAVGFGDAKLGLSVGILLGASAGFSAIVLAFWIGTLAVLPWLLFFRKLNMKSEIPFAPFIILGAWMSLIFNPDLLYVTSF